MGRETCPIRLEVGSYTAPVSILNNQSSSIPTNQKNLRLANQDSAIQTNRTVQIWIPRPHRNGPIGDQGRNFPRKAASPLGPGCSFGFLRFASCSLQQFLLFPAPQTGGADVQNLPSPSLTWGPHDHLSSHSTANTEEPLTWKRMKMRNSS